MILARSIGLKGFAGLGQRYNRTIFQGQKYHRQKPTSIFELLLVSPHSSVHWSTDVLGFSIRFCDNWIFPSVRTVRPVSSI